MRILQGAGQRTQSGYCPAEVRWPGQTPAPPCQALQTIHGRAEIIKCFRSRRSFLGGDSKLLRSQSEIVKVTSCESGVDIITLVVKPGSMGHGPSEPMRPDTRAGGKESSLSSTATPADGLDTRPECCGKSPPPGHTHQPSAETSLPAVEPSRHIAAIVSHRPAGWPPALAMTAARKRIAPPAPLSAMLLCHRRPRISRPARTARDDELLPFAPLSPCLQRVKEKRLSHRGWPLNFQNICYGNRWRDSTLIEGIRE